jgi:dihydroorotase
MKKLIVIKNGFIVDSKYNKVCDILIEDGKIKEIGDVDYTNTRVIDATNLYIIPGLVDNHCHLREPGYEYKEDIKSGTEAAALGGFTTISCMPNTNPAIDSKESVENLLKLIREKAIIDVYPIGAISIGQMGKKLTDVASLKKSGVIAISDDGYPVSNPSLMVSAIIEAYKNEIKVISHCEDLNYSGVMNEGEISKKLGLKGIPSKSEESMVERDVLIAEALNMPIHIAHISTKGSVEIIRNAKKRGVKVTCETCPHYFSLTEDILETKGTLGKVNPPLRTKEDVEAIIEGLKDGTIDIIATDHAPHSINEKTDDFDKSANGLSGFELAFSIAMTYLVKPGHLSMNDLVEKMSYNPSKILGLNRGCIREGSIADITIVDPNKEYVVDVGNFKSKGKNTSFDGMMLSGKVKHVIKNGKVIVYDEKLNYEHNCCKRNNDAKENMKVIENERIALNVFKMILQGDLVSNMKVPGQFVMMGIRGMILRRPISICEIDHVNEYLTIIYKVVGEGTRYMSERKNGDTLDVFGPLGNGFPIEASNPNDIALLVGGGIGVPPLYELAKQLHQNKVNVISVLGFQTKDDVFYEDEFKKYGNVFVCTNDGSVGFKGYVTDLIRNYNMYFNTLYGCGPIPMLKAISDEYPNIEGYLSFEEMMACGIGACFGCAIPRADGKGYLKVCKDGPVFKIGSVKSWK